MAIKTFTILRKAAESLTAGIFWTVLVSAAFHREIHRHLPMDTVTNDITQYSRTSKQPGTTGHHDSDSKVK